MTDSIYERPELYDQIYSEKDYKSESEDIVERLAERGVEAGSRVLEAACGTGNYLEHLRDHFQVVGFDANQSMLERAGEKCPDVALFRGDFHDFDVDEPFDAVLCLFSSIGYAHGLEGLRRAAHSMRQAVRDSGVIIIDPWVMDDQFIDGLASMQTYESAERKIARQVVSERKGRLSPMEFHWLVADEGEGVEHFSAVHELYVFSRQEYQDALDHAGFDVNFDPDGLIGRGLFIGVAR